MEQVTLYKDKDQWMVQLDIYYNRFQTAGWDFINTLREGIDQFGRTSNEKADIYNDIAPQLGYSVRTLQNWVSAARSPAARIAQDEELTIYHVTAVQALPDGEAEEVLYKAKSEGWSAEETKTYIWQQKAKAASHGTMNRQPEPPAATELARPVRTLETLQDLQQMRGRVEHRRWLSAIGAVFPPIIYPEEDRDVAICTRIQRDVENWTMADHCLHCYTMEEHKRRLNPRVSPKEQTFEQRRASLIALYEMSDSEFERYANIARTFPEHRRRQSTVIGFSHHRLLVNRSREEQEYYLDLCAQHGLSASQLEAELTGGRA